MRRSNSYHDRQIVNILELLKRNVDNWYECRATDIPKPVVTKRSANYDYTYTRDIRGNTYITTIELHDTRLRLELYVDQLYYGTERVVTFKYGSKRSQCPIVRTLTFPAKSHRSTIKKEIEALYTMMLIEGNYIF